MEFSLENRIEALTLETSSENTPQIPPLIVNSRQCYSLLDKTAGEDKERVQKERLKYVLDCLQKEREDTCFSRDCLFCKKHFTGNRSMLLNHLIEQHNFLLGAPDNIVFINEFLDHLENMLKELRCFFCEKIFKDWMVLKEHMRKKQHKRINPQNKFYDRFYIINYLELGKSWVDVQREEDDFGSQEENDKEIMDWADDRSVFVCLFCEAKFEDFDTTLKHMGMEHKFDFNFLKKKYQLNFYQQIKLINFIRKKVHEKMCLMCDRQFSFHRDLLQHLLESGHSSDIPDSSLWDQSMYFFSTFENDNMLCGLEVEDSDCQENWVVPEETFIPTASLNI